MKERSGWWVLACAVAFSSLALAGTARSAPAPAAPAAHKPVDNAEPRSGPSFAVGKIFLRFADRRRKVSIPGRGRTARSLLTVVRYPAVGDPSRVDVSDAAPASGRFPLIVFAHGYAVTPSIYARLLRTWTRAGYVVAAPVFPLTNVDAPGGPNRTDLVNQPTDMSFVISRMLASSAGRRGPLSRLIDPSRVAVSGQSDGGSTALAAAYNRHYVDHRIRAAMILSGAEIPGIGGYDFPAPSPPLLATQGTADVVNAPAATYHFFRIAPPPKYLLSLLGGPHLGPYTDQEPQLGIVERVSAAFLDRFLKHRKGARARMWKNGDVPNLSRLSR